MRGVFIYSQLLSLSYTCLKRKGYGKENNFHCFYRIFDIVDGYNNLSAVDFIEIQLEPMQG